MAITKVTRNYQITVPKEIRKMIQLKLGDEMLVRADKDDIILRKIRKDASERAFGIWTEMKGSSVAYVRKMRQGSEKRRKRLGL